MLGAQRTLLLSGALSDAYLLKESTYGIGEQDKLTKGDLVCLLHFGLI